MNGWAQYYPSHARTSCSDEHPVNASGDGQGCARCTALLLDQRDRLQAALAEMLAVEEQREDIARRKQRRENWAVKNPGKARAVKAEHEAWKVRRFRALNEARAAVAEGVKAC